MNAFKTLLTAALATAALAAPAAAMCTGDTCYDYTSEGDQFGNDDFGVEYSFSTLFENRAGHLAQLQDLIDQYQHHVDNGILSFMALVIQTQTRYDAATSLPDDYVKTQAQASIEASVLGKTRSILEGSAGFAYGDLRFSASQTLSVLGRDVGMGDLTSVERNLVSMEQTFVEVSTTIWAAGIPLTVKGSVNGELGVDGRGSIGNGLDISIDPYAILYASASVGVGAACASAGVQGNLDLLNVTMVNEVQYDISGCGLEATVESTLGMSTMNGSIELYAELCGVDWSEELVSWDGIDLGSWDLFRDNDCIPL